MSEQKPTLGRAIDQVIEALTPFDAKERSTILSTVCDHLQVAGIGSRPLVAAAAPAARVPPTDPVAVTTRGAAHASHDVDIKALKNEKQPNSARQMACLVAYYLQEHAPEDEKKATITTEDLEKYFKRANYKLPTKLEQLLVDCKRSGYVESTATRGEYRLTRVGYNLVTHGMPPKQGA